jgi:lipopolysaccharide biosynthesis glycosyltransferase
MNILYTLNDAFVPQVAAGITSICENNKDVDDITFYLMSLNIKKENEDKLEEYVSSYGRKIKFIELNDMQNFFKFKII